MLRRLLESFTATHVTILTALAILVPGALYAVPSFTNVAIEDIYTGARAAVSPNRRLFVDDPIAGYRNNPANAVDITVLNSGGCDTGYTYTPPSGKALVIAAVSGYVFASHIGPGERSGYYLSTGTDCSGTVLTSWLTQDADAPVAVEFGNGIPVPAGQSVTVASSNTEGSIHIHGFLVPANAVPRPERPMRPTKASRWGPTSSRHGLPH